MSEICNGGKRRRSLNVPSKEKHGGIEQTLSLVKPTESCFKEGGQEEDGKILLNSAYKPWAYTTS